MKATVPKCKNWNELKKELQKHDITASFKNKGNTNEIQGVMFEKNGYRFNGSKIDRQFSYSKIDSQLMQNDKTQDFQVKQEQNHSQNQSSALEKVGSALGGLFDISSSGLYYNPDEAEFQYKYNLSRKKKRGFRI